MLDYVVLTNKPDVSSWYNEKLVKPKIVSIVKDASNGSWVVWFILEDSGHE